MLRSSSGAGMSHHKWVAHRRTVLLVVFLWVRCRSRCTFPHVRGQSPPALYTARGCVPQHAGPIRTPLSSTACALRPAAVHFQLVPVPIDCKRHIVLNVHYLCRNKANPCKQHAELRPSRACLKFAYSCGKQHALVLEVVAGKCCGVVV